MTSRALSPTIPVSVLRVMDKDDFKPIEECYAFHRESLDFYREVQEFMESVRKDHAELTPVLKELTDTIHRHSDSLKDFKQMFKEAVPISTVYKILTCIVVVVALIEGVQWVFKFGLPHLFS